MTAGVAPEALLPERSAPPPSALTPEDELIRRQPFCVASSAPWAGTLGDVVVYRYARHGDRLDVGYFVYWSTERPWGDNALTRRVLPALAIDAFYSHFAFVLPGAQRVLYGPGDIEGVLVRYRIRGDRLVPEQAFAEDESHRSVELAPEELLTGDGRVLVLTESWSHQLGAHHAVQRTGADAASCFDASRLEPLSPATAAAFRLGSPGEPLRAKPAWRHFD